MTKAARLFIAAYIALTVMLSVGVWSIGLNVYSGMNETDARAQGAIACATIQVGAFTGHDLQATYVGFYTQAWEQGCKAAGVTHITHQ